MGDKDCFAGTALIKFWESETKIAILCPNCKKRSNITEKQIKYDEYTCTHCGFTDKT
ncbi:Predicted integral membrane zinc-ribbon metal-binding protein [Thermoclostridium caenicola]|uniref:Predicted integral membrane zinc-ribbon metal-binding protein n=1 Tax=Thermoclostridium caenicola TaxID=659425 RepID=A0A1M6GTT7_9FIRM|nr:Predicted integral membrane zinc-ribbon metal-binding protein [Thermoclostridium caenicola]